MLLPEYIDKREREGWKYKIRPYQLEAMRSLNRTVSAKKNNTMLVIPTGGGKTATCMVWLAYVMKQNPKAKVLWIVHRETLIEQAIECL